MKAGYAAFMTPPAPFVLVRLGHLATPAVSENVLAQIDCGADRTVIPWSFVESLELAPTDSVKVAGFGGEVSEERLYPIRLHLANFPSVDLDVLTSDGEQFVLLGRDVLNRYRVVLDVPNLTLEIT